MRPHLGLFRQFYSSVAVWDFKSSSEAFAKGQTKAVSHGDILRVPSEGVVGFADRKFKQPFAMSKTHGKLTDIATEIMALRSTNTDPLTHEFELERQDAVTSWCENLSIADINIKCALILMLTADLEADYTLFKGVAA